MVGRGALATALWLVAALVQAQAEPERELDRELAREARLEEVLRVTLARSPTLSEADLRARAAASRADGAGSLPEPELKYEQWSVPLRRPYALSRADMLMFGVRQSFPAPGTRRARARMAKEEASVAAEQREATLRELARRVRLAYFAYYAAHHACDVHAEHLRIAEQTIAQLRASYESGRGSQQELLRALVELSRLSAEQVESERQRQTSRFMLNALMARPTDAPLGPPVLEGLPSAPQASAQALAAGLDALPELAAARGAVRRAEAAAEEARYTARRPAFMAGADYWLTPRDAEQHDDPVPAYGAMVAMSLPWLNRSLRAEAHAAEQGVRAERAAERAAAFRASYALHEAVAGYEAARASLTLIARDVLPQAEKSLDAVRSAFHSGQGDLLALLDALRSYYQVRLERSALEARVFEQLTEVAFASGAKLTGPSMEVSP